jgi:hypothetical protein
MGRGEAAQVQRVQRGRDAIMCCGSDTGKSSAGAVPCGHSPWHAPAIQRVEGFQLNGDGGAGWRKSLCQWMHCFGRCLGMRGGLTEGISRG